MERSGDEGKWKTQRAAELAAKDKLCCDVYTMGLPKEFKMMTLNSLPRAEDQTMEKLELVTTNLRERKFLEDGESRPCPGVEKFGTSWKFPETVRRIPLLKCWGCGGEHKQKDCPKRKEKISGRLRSQSSGKKTCPRGENVDDDVGDADDW